MLLNKRKKSWKNCVGVYGSVWVELLVVVVILGIIAAVSIYSFNLAQSRSRDIKRKSDLSQISAALEVYHRDFGVYPGSSGGKILGCPTGNATPCGWGVDPSDFTDSVTNYMRVVPSDPTDGYSYFYRTLTVNSSPNQGYQLYARLEDNKDRSCILGSCGSLPDLPAGVNCGNGIKCNFAVTSKGVTATQD